MEKASKDIISTSLTISRSCNNLLNFQLSLSFLRPGRKTSTPLYRGRGRKENRGIRQQSPQVISPQVSFQKTLDDSQVNIGDKLPFFLLKWREITSDPMILQVVSGYKLPFKHHPPLQNIEPSVHLSLTKELTCC